MRRPPEVGQAGLLVILLLGASGCAGFPQRTIGTAPGSAPADGQSALAAGPLLVVAPGELAKRRGRDCFGRSARNGQARTALPFRESACGESLARNAIGVDGSQLPAIQPDLERGPDRGTRAEVGGPADDLSNEPRSEQSAHVRNARNGSRSLVPIEPFDRLKGLPRMTRGSNADRSASASPESRRSAVFTDAAAGEVSSPKHARAGERDSGRQTTNARCRFHPT